VNSGQSVYSCPKCQTLLKEEVNALFCQRCSRLFSITRNIVNLDIVNSSEQYEFDSMFNSSSTLSEEEKYRSTILADRILKLVDSQYLESKTILEIAAGRGELGYGIIKRSSYSKFYITDHSRVSLEIFKNSINENKNDNILNFSLQDVNCLAFASQKFDLIFGHAALHHFLDFEKVVKSCFRLLNPMGKMVYSEPFFPGYFNVIKIWIEIMEEESGEDYLPTESEFQIDGEFGYLKFIVNNVISRSRRDRNILKTMTDKHLFLDSDFYKIANELGAKVELYDYNSEEETFDFMKGMLDTYLINNNDFREKSMNKWNKILGMATNSFYGSSPHFKNIVITKIDD
jgi:ubiquinone/menaquinone biosynthesis C-methylase UbiE